MSVFFSNHLQGDLNILSILAVIANIRLYWVISLSKMPEPGIIIVIAIILNIFFQFKFVNLFFFVKNLLS